MTGWQEGAQTILYIFTVYSSIEDPGTNILLDTLATWGPEFSVSLELYINSFDTNQYTEILRFTAANQPSIRYPFIQSK